MPKDYPDCPSQEQMMKYFRSYVDHWGLRDFIRFNTTVNKVTPLEEGGSGYKIVLSDGSEHTYRGLVICVGHHRIPNPIHDKFPGGALINRELVCQRLVRQVFWRGYSLQRVQNA
eukprot:GHVN01007519.1.p1 GENE.GHVN01007519.1~~GHVN01007519.1.p1  ORF type:complete len:115 (+),score=7.70 GHVN01007519.1:220-564(+)